MTEFHAGAAGFLKRRDQYAKRLRFVEWTPPEPTPRPGTLGRWRTELPASFRFALVAPSSLWGERDWPLRDAAALERGLQWLGHAVAALKPEVLVLRSPPAVRPGTAGLRRLKELFPRVERLAERLVWDPVGLWEREEALAEVAGTKVVVACDPLHDAPKSEAVVYARIRGLGTQRRLHAGRLEDVALALRDSQVAYVVFDSEDALAEAVRFSKLVSDPEALAALAPPAEGELSYEEGDEFEEEDLEDSELDDDDEEDDGDLDADSEEATEDGFEEGDDEDDDEEDEDDEDAEED